MKFLFCLGLVSDTFHLAPIRMFTNVYLKDLVQGHVQKYMMLTYSRKKESQIG